MQCITFIYNLMMLGFQAFSTSGRNPSGRMLGIGENDLKKLATVGGGILNLPNEDPTLAGLSNRLYGVDDDFIYTTIPPTETGFFQFNHAHAGLFRKDNWLIFTKGFSDNMWGSEIYNTSNRYGRYQSYGAQEIIYPGSKLENGYDAESWDWNFNPGTTVIRLPWDKLHAEKGRIDEQQQKRFAGSLQLENKNAAVLTKVHGTYGMFAMDFQEQENQGFSTVHSSNNHNATFTFKKSNFYFEDIIVCLGSGISNDDSDNNTVTTLYQRLDNNASSTPIINGNAVSSLGDVSYDSASNTNWLLSNYNTGFYIFPENNTLIVNKEVQQTPNFNQIWPVDYSSNATGTYYKAYIDHGTTPNNKGYEYILKPGTTASEMATLHADITSSGKPYVVHKKDSEAHIVSYTSKNIWGYAVFADNLSVSNDVIKTVAGSCMIMTKKENSAANLLLSIVNPDLGFQSRSYAPSIQTTSTIVLDGIWNLVSTYEGVELLGTTTNETTLRFTLKDGLAKEVELELYDEECTGSLVKLLDQDGWSYYGEVGSSTYLFGIEHTPAGGNTNTFTANVLFQKSTCPLYSVNHAITDSSNNEAIYVNGDYWNIETSSGNY